MTTRSKYVLGQLRFYDDTTYETMGEMMPIQYRQDFIGAGAQVIPAAGSAVDGWDWVKKLVLTAGSPTVAGVANAAGGQAAATIDSTSEKQEATLYHGDNLAFDVTKGLVFECRVQLKTLPSAAAVEVVWGLQSAWIDGPDNANYYAGFGATGSGVVNMRTQDGVTQNKLATPTTLVAAAFHVFRVDFGNLSDVRFFIDGVQQNTDGQISFAATGANAVLQPYFGVYKASGVGLGEIIVDDVTIWNNRT